MFPDLGHDRMTTSIASYGQVSAERQREIIENLGRTPDEDEKALRLGREMLKTVRGMADGQSSVGARSLQ